MSETVTIVPYHDRYKADFDRLNRAWVTEHFTVESGDEAELGDPYAHFIAPGGQVLFLLTDTGQVAGTAALLPHGAGTWELAKMTVDAAHRGNGYGARLLEAALEYARNAGAGAVELVSNTKLETAIRLYRRYGFVEVPLAEGEAYARANIRMRREW